MNPSNLLQNMRTGDVRALARCISLVENESEGYEDLLFALDINQDIPVIGITGPPGAGKSTIVNALIGLLSKEGKRIGVIAIDPTSPFNFGSILGDRIRMSEHFLDEKVFIRSLATRGSLGGLSAKTIEITDVMRAFPFDVIIVETVGVGQSEVEIIGLADTTVVVLVPEGGDEIQGIKSGVMEIADVFVVNKADRDGADLFINNLRKLLHDKEAKAWNVPVVRTVASQQEGIAELNEKIREHFVHRDVSKKEFLLTEKAYRLIQNHRMKNIDKQGLHEDLRQALKGKEFNLYTFVQKYFS
jgi:LAO/AO transport system kinase